MGEGGSDPFKLHVKRVARRATWKDYEDEQVARWRGQLEAQAHTRSGTSEDRGLRLLRVRPHRGVAAELGGSHQEGASCATGSTEMG